MMTSGWRDRAICSKNFLHATPDDRQTALRQVEQLDGQVGARHERVRRVSRLLLALQGAGQDHVVSSQLALGKTEQQAAGADLDVVRVAPIASRQSGSLDGAFRGNDGLSARPGPGPAAPAGCLPLPSPSPRLRDCPGSGAAKSSRSPGPPAGAAPPPQRAATRSARSALPPPPAVPPPGQPAPHTTASPDAAPPNQTMITNRTPAPTRRRSTRGLTGYTSGALRLPRHLRVVAWFP